MKHRTLTAGLLLVALLGCQPAPTMSSFLAKPRGGMKAGQVMVAWRPATQADKQAEVLTRLGATRLAGEGLTRQLVAVPDGQELAMCARFREDAAIAYAEPNYLTRTRHVPGSLKLRRQVQFLPNDQAYVSGPLSSRPEFTPAWGLRAIGAEAAWDVTAGSPQVLVAVIDTGADMNHPDLIGNLDQERATNLVEAGQAVDDDFGHGTHVAGIIAATGNNGIGNLGVAWKTRVMPIRVLGVDGTGETWNTISAIELAVAAGAKVINLSLGSPDRSDIEAEVIAEALAAGTLLVAAAGNEATDGNYLEFPASYPGVVSVGAVGPDRKRAAFSNFNSQVTLVAPGVDILSTIPSRMSKDPYGFLSGTSMAAPMVSGVAALVFAAHPTWTPAQVTDTLKKTALRLAPEGDLQDYNVFFGSGMVQAGKALGR